VSDIYPSKPKMASMAPAVGHGAVDSTRGKNWRAKTSSAAFANGESFVFTNPDLSIKLQLDFATRSLMFSA
jgi:hypothetical protein